MLKAIKHLLHNALLLPKSKYIKLSLAIVYTIFLTTILLIDSSENIKYPWLKIKNIDKLIHVCIFGVFAFVWFIAYSKEKYLKYILIFGILYSVVLEIMQQYVSNRQFDLGDIIANIVGISIVCAFILRYLKIKNKKLNKV